MLSDIPDIGGYIHLGFWQSDSISSLSGIQTIFFSLPPFFLFLFIFLSLMIITVRDRLVIILISHGWEKNDTVCNEEEKDLSLLVREQVSMKVSKYQT